MIRTVLVLLYVSALFAVVLQPLVQFVGNLRIGRFSLSAGGHLHPFAVRGWAGWWRSGFWPCLQWPGTCRNSARKCPSGCRGIMDRLHHVPLANQINVADLAEQIQNYAGQSATYLLLSIRNWAGSLFTIAMGLILTIYFTLEGDVAYRWALSLFPARSRAAARWTLRRAEVRMGRWLIGQGSLMLILGLTSTVVYMSLHVRYASALGVLTGLLNIIPVLGAALCIVLALLAAAVDSWGRVLGVGIFYLCYLWLENSFLTPRIMKSSVDLPGLAIIVALLLGGELAGRGGRAGLRADRGAGRGTGD